MSSTNRSNARDEHIIWKTIDDFPNYKVNNLGDVINIKTNYILKPSERKGYLRVALYNSTNVKRKTVHRLVAAAFIPNPNNLPQINHIDGNKKNNNVKNLEWCDNSQNQLHAWENGLQHRTENHKRQLSKLIEENKKTKRKLSENQVRFIRKNYIKGKTTYKYFADMFEVSGKTIEYVVKNIRYKEVI